MTRKYEITTFQHPEDPNLFRIRALRDIPIVGVKKGDLGGYVQYESNLGQLGDCWIGGDACVCKDAQVYDNARVYGKVLMYVYSPHFADKALFSRTHTEVYGNAIISEGACVCGGVIVNGNAKISGFSRITSPDQLYYSDGVTVYFNENKELTINGTSPDIEHHKMLARLKLL